MTTTKRGRSLVRKKSEIRHSGGHSLRRLYSSPSMSCNLFGNGKVKPRLLTTTTTTSKVLIKDPSTSQLKVENNEDAWGYLVREGGETYTLDRELDKRLDNQAAGYIIGKKEDCDIRLYLKGASDVHAIIYCRHRSINNVERFVPYVFDRSSNGTWVNFKKIQNGAIELKTGDIIHFMDPKLYNEAANPTYKFVKPKTSTTRARAVEDLYVLKSRIAEGTYGVVQLAECKRTKKRVAIKLIRNSMCHGRKKLRDAFLKEISVCMSMPVHPCIIQISKVYEQDDIMYIVMEYSGKNGDLFECVASYQFKEYEVKIIFDQIAHAIAFLHERNIVHRDIKLENVVIFDRERLIVKLCDFGLSTFMRPGRLLETNCGTVMYAAPELIDCPNGYGKEVDIWSLGVLLFTALVAFTPFLQRSEAEEHKRETIDQIKRGDFNFDCSVWDDISHEAKDLIRKMMTVDKSKRYTIKQVLAHPWLQDLEKSTHPDLTRNPELVSYLERNKN
ncbi:hypothetical protein G6F70_001313 [Rhizopus microsporus]|nr:hypothetical protein G6F71_001429 [Rhizopus microsporus]KAG1203520.1 hypothetical protein G6F70_001313 [Rhizopus microsporus]KAG1215152.1 hypothetical protein G6F69_001276 [Rhizopus microsporus]KAG1236545.1 hypothetical protein G6F67_001915 [Rhizopus microsporus]KAG1268141.1 hypothetical protein G6F68_001365 [Rhizopus microsporus]